MGSDDLIRRRNELRRELYRLGRDFRIAFAEYRELEPWRDPLEPETVRQIRDTIGMTQKDFATACGLSRTMTISEFERGIGEVTGPTRRVMIMLYERFALEVETIRNREGLIG